MRKSGQPREIPPPLELDCLKALWELQQGSVKDVRRALTRDRDLAYTTVMTLLERLARKGGVVRRKVGRSFVYEALLSREHLRALAVRELVDCFFEGSEEKLAEYLNSARPREALLSAAAAAGQGAPGASSLDTALL